jgi:hypothetical protein
MPGAGCPIHDDGFIVGMGGIAMPHPIFIRVPIYDSSFIVGMNGVRELDGLPPAPAKFLSSPFSYKPLKTNKIELHMNFTQLSTIEIGRNRQPWYSAESTKSRFCF